MRSACSITMSVALGTSTPTSITVVATRSWITFALKAAITCAFSTGFRRPWTRPTARSGKVALMVSKVSIAVFSCSASDSSMSGQTQ